MSGDSHRGFRQGFRKKHGHAHRSPESGLHQTVPSEKRVKRSRRPTYTLQRSHKRTSELLLRQEEIIVWIEKVLSLTKDTTLPFIDWLADGVILCRLANAIVPGAVKHFHSQPTVRFQMIQNVNLFIGASQRAGIFERAGTDPFVVGRSFRKAKWVTGEQNRS